MLELADEAEGRIEVAFHDLVDYEFMVYAVRDGGLWEWVLEVVLPVTIDALSGTVQGQLAAEECYREIGKRGLRRHHALADALALRAAYIAVKGIALGK